jgi:RHH-type transcriptional regulator, rel operon repressor / antitoxin RelB
MFLPWRIFVLLCIQSITSVSAMSSTTFTVRVETDVKKRLEKLAKSTGRSRSFLAAEALSEYLDVNEWQVAGVRKAMGSLDRGESISHEQVKAWIYSWSGKRERPAPRRSAK